MNRRNFLKAGVASTAVAAAGTGYATGERTHKAVVAFDSRFAEARRFAAIAAAQHGLPTLGFAGDANAHWHEQLAGAIGQGKAVIGLTAGGSLLHEIDGQPKRALVCHVAHAFACPRRSRSDTRAKRAPIWPCAVRRAETRNF